MNFFSGSKKVEVVAIDGPAGSGKSTVSRWAANKLKFLYADTGAMYRAVTLAALERGVSLDDHEGLTVLSKMVAIRFIPFVSGQKVSLDDVDVTQAIREPRVDENVSAVSAVHGVRESMVERQRGLLASHPEARGLVMEGRDIGTVVFPNARWKFFLTADPEERARRRQGDLKKAGIDESLMEVLSDIERRDHLDSNRSESPLTVAEGAEILDTTRMTIEEVVSHIVRVVRHDFPDGR